MRERKQTCVACNKEKSIDQFPTHNYGTVLVVGNFCYKCLNFGRIPARKKHAGGRPEIDLPIEEMKELYSKGYGYKAIARILKERGINVSHTTISRKLSETHRTL